jgi:pyrroloquinoline-quinone synthase
VLDSEAPPRPEPPLSEHPLVKHYGLDVEHLALTKAHREVEGEHRAAAWRVMLEHVPAADHLEVVAAMEEALRHWQAYRDGVAAAVGLTRAE